jgi:hypothetical protein
LEAALEVNLAVDREVSLGVSLQADPEMVWEGGLGWLRRVHEAQSWGEVGMTKEEAVATSGGLPKTATRN